MSGNSERHPTFSQNIERTNLSTENPSPAADLPAILGGAPVRPEGPPGWPVRDEEILETLKKSWESGDWGRYQGPQIEQLRERLSGLLQVEHTFPCASGTVAVELALRGLKVGASDEVILAAYDFKGNFQNVLAVGAIPVLVEISARDWQLDPEQILAAVTPRTKVILASHLHGGIVRMPEIVALAAKHGLAVIEDACQMPGALIGGRQAGTWGDAGVWSFGGSKLLTAGRGGALFTRRDDIIQRIRLYTQRGNEAYPLSELQAAVLLPQLDQLAARNTIRHENASRLRQLLAAVPGLVPFPTPLTDSLPGYYKFGIQFQSELWELSRNQFAKAMRAEGIAMDAGFRSLHRIHSAGRYRTASLLSEADRADEQVLTLHHPVLLTRDVNDLQHIVTAAERIRRHAKQISNNDR